MSNTKNFSKMSEKVTKFYTNRHLQEHKDQVMESNLANLSPEVQKVVRERIANRKSNK